MGESFGTPDPCGTTDAVVDNGQLLIVILTPDSLPPEGEGSGGLVLFVVIKL